MMPNFNFLKDPATGKVSFGTAAGFVLALTAGMWVASKVPILKKVV